MKSTRTLSALNKDKKWKLKNGGLGYVKTSSESSLLRVFKNYRQVILLLTCWLNKQTVFMRGIHNNIFATLSAIDLSGKINCCNTVSLFHATS
jgi:hypothetical protein